MEDGLEAIDTCLDSLETKVFANRCIPKDPPWFVVGKNAASSVVVCIVFRPSLVLTIIGGAEIGDGIGGSNDSPAILFVCSNHGHGSQDIEWFGRKVEVFEAEWHNRMLFAKPIWNCGFIGIRNNCDDLWFQRSDGGDSNCLPCHCSS